jgi:hypothetical protein
MRNFHGNIPFATTNLWFGKRKTMGKIKLGG